MPKTRTPEVRPDAPENIGKRNAAVSDKPAPPSGATPPEKTKPARELSDLQELVCDVLGDLILNGGSHENLNDVIVAAIDHSWYMRFDAPLSEYCPNGSKYMDRTFEQWRTALIQDWPKKQPPVEEKPAATFSEQVRAGMRYSLRECFSEFIVAATPEEIRLMSEVLANWESTSHGPDNDRAEIGLAEAMGYHLETKHTYMRIPREHAAMVEEYAKMLRKTGKPGKVN